MHQIILGLCFYAEMSAAGLSTFQKLDQGIYRRWPRRRQIVIHACSDVAHSTKMYHGYMRRKHAKRYKKYSPRPVLFAGVARLCSGTALKIVNLGTRSS